MLDKMLSARFIAMVLVIGTLCAAFLAVLLIAMKVIADPEAFKNALVIIGSVSGMFGSVVTLIVKSYFDRSDRPETQQNKPEFSKTVQFLLISLICGGFLVSPSIARADDPAAYFRLFNQIEFTYPLAHTNVIYLFGLGNRQSLIGAETKLVTWPRTAIALPEYMERLTNHTFIAPDKVNINFGAITSFDANGMPFISIDFNLRDSTYLPPMAGLWYGHDFKINANWFGVKASKRLW